MLNSDINLITLNNKVYATSRDIAEKLNKDHDKVCKKIKEVLTVAEFCERNFTTNQGNIYKEYLLDKDAFILLLFNYTGYNDFKRAYIKKFNQMEQQLKIKQPPLTNIQQKALSKLKDMLKDVGCLLTWNDLMEIQHKATVKDVCQYLASNYFVNVGNISNSLRELESNYINEYLLKK